MGAAWDPVEVVLSIVDAAGRANCGTKYSAGKLPGSYAILRVCNDAMSCSSIFMVSDCPPSLLPPGFH